MLLNFSHVFHIGFIFSIERIMRLAVQHKQELVGYSYQFFNANKHFSLIYLTT